VLASSSCAAARTASRARRDEAVASRERIGYPVLVRPSYVLGGRAMEIVYDAERCALHALAPSASSRAPGADRQFLETPSRSTSTRQRRHDVVVGGIMEHIERAGVHSGDSACSLPPYSIDATVQDEIAARRSRSRASSASSA
jgi:carbamoyl-phosphate synthase large subunit